MMANTSAIWQQATHTTYQLSSPSCSTRAIQEAHLFTENGGYFFEKGQETWPLTEKWQITKSKRTRQKYWEKRSEKGIKRQPWDCRQEDDRHARSPPFGVLCTLWGFALRNWKEKKVIWCRLLILSTSIAEDSCGWVVSIFSLFSCHLDSERNSTTTNKATRELWCP